VPRPRCIHEPNIRRRTPVQYQQKPPPRCLTSRGTLLVTPFRVRPFVTAAAARKSHTSQYHEAGGRTPAKGEHLAVGYSPLLLIGHQSPDGAVKHRVPTSSHARASVALITARVNNRHTTEEEATLHAHIEHPQIRSAKGRCTELAASPQTSTQYTGALGIGFADRMTEKRLLLFTHCADQCVNEKPEDTACEL
jgi:hypothetical protein